MKFTECLKIALYLVLILTIAVSAICFVGSIFYTLFGLVGLSIFGVFLFVLILASMIYQDSN